VVGGKMSDKEFLEWLYSVLLDGDIDKESPTMRRLLLIIASYPEANISKEV